MIGSTVLRSIVLRSTLRRAGAGADRYATWYGAALSAARVGLGVSALVDPARFERGWFGPASSQAPGAPAPSATSDGDTRTGAAMETVLRATGIRDVALGLGTLAALGTGDHPQRWLCACALADAGDAAATGLAARRLPVSRVLLIGGGAAASAAVSLFLARALSRR